MKALDPNYTGPSAEAIAATESKPKRTPRKPKTEGTEAAAE